MAIVHQSSAQATGSGPNVTVNKPTGTASGDLLLALIGSVGNISSTPSGWTLLTTSGTNFVAYYRVADGTEGASFTWTVFGSFAWTAGISRYSGVDPTTPIDVAASYATGTSASPSAPSVTTVTANAMVIGGTMGTVGTITVTPPASLTEQWEQSPTEHASAVQAVAGATGAKTWTWSASNNWSAFVSALRSSAAATQTITATGIPSAEAFGSDSAQFAPIQPTGVPSGETFGAAALSPGVATISPTGVPSSESFGTAALVTTGQIAGAGIPSGEAFGTASIHGAAVTITVPSIGSAEAFGVPALANDEFDGDLILTWVVDKRANRVRFVFESTESMSSLRVRELEVWARSTGRQ